MPASDYEVLDPRFGKLFNGNAGVRRLYKGCQWAEGPVWFAAGRYLLWSDIPDNWQGKRLNSPNDVVVKSDGSIWFTDPAYGIESDYEGDKSKSEIGACYVYRVDPGSGEVRVV